MPTHTTTLHKPWKQARKQNRNITKGTSRNKWIPQVTKRWLCRQTFSLDLVLSLIPCRLVPPCVEGRRNFRPWARHVAIIWIFMFLFPSIFFYVLKSPDLEQGKTSAKLIEIWYLKWEPRRLLYSSSIHGNLILTALWQCQFTPLADSNTEQNLQPVRR